MKTSHNMLSESQIRAQKKWREKKYREDTEWRKKQINAAKNKYLELIRFGICPQCRKNKLEINQKTSQLFSACSNCRLRTRERAKKNYAEKIKIGYYAPSERQKEAKRLYRLHKNMIVVGRFMSITPTAVWRLLNRKKINQQFKKDYQKNPKKFQEKIRQYKIKNPEKIKEWKKRAIEKYRKQGRCWQCGTKCAINPHTQSAYFLCQKHRKINSEANLKIYYQKKKK